MVCAQETENNLSSVEPTIAAKVENFEATVIDILGQQKITRPDGTEGLQQDVKLLGETGNWKGKQVIYKGIGDIDVISRNVYEVGDRVLVQYSPNANGEDVFYITDFVRHRKIIWLMLAFILSIVVVARWKGLMSLVSLIFTFIIILYFIIPHVFNGSSPILITVIGCLLILPTVIYLTEGFNRAAHLAILSIFISLIITGILSLIFSAITKLSGVATEEIMYIVGAGKGAINFKGLLLAGMIIGSLGVIDDVVISQIASVEQLQIANPDLKKSEIFRRAMKIGVSHIGSMTNTLFLAYAGASLPLLLVFSIKQEPFMSLSQILNNEMIVTEIVRTLVGSIGLALSVPIATFLATQYLINKKQAIR